MPNNLSTHGDKNHSFRYRYETVCFVNPAVKRRLTSRPCAGWSSTSWPIPTDA